jgi:hypothetical protein
MLAPSGVNDFVRFRRIIPKDGNAKRVSSLRPRLDGFIYRDSQARRPWLSSDVMNALGSELARSDKRVRDVATTGFSRMVEILAAHFDQARPAEARKRAMATAAAMVGAVTMSRVVTDQKLSDSLLHAVEESITRG